MGTTRWSDSNCCGHSARMAKWPQQPGDAWRYVPRTHDAARSSMPKAEAGEQTHAGPDS